jgi:hypothetical protein
MKPVLQGWYDNKSVGTCGTLEHGATLLVIKVHSAVEGKRKSYNKRQYITYL